MMIRACSPVKRLGELGRALVDLRDHAVGVLELVDRLLELPVEHARSVMTMTLSNTLSSPASCSVDSRWASQAMVFDLPEPAECWTR